MSTSVSTARRHYLSDPFTGERGVADVAMSTVRAYRGVAIRNDQDNNIAQGCAGPARHAWRPERPCMLLASASAAPSGF